MCPPGDCLGQPGVAPSAARELADLTAQGRGSTEALGAEVADLTARLADAHSVLAALTARHEQLEETLRGKEGQAAPPRG